MSKCIICQRKVHFLHLQDIYVSIKTWSDSKLTWKRTYGCCSLCLYDLSKRSYEDMITFIYKKIIKKGKKK